MKVLMTEIANVLEARIAFGPAELQKVESDHEVGTSRLGDNPKTSVTDRDGKIHGIDNLFVADASVFPCVGVANSMLTITALGYRLAEHICKSNLL